ncbi:Unknown protein sequence [Pseudomonas syringae pv. maculicola]|nr:Unknown protein sequence [Pseudomonas syringae pv. maculicola]
MLFNHNGTDIAEPLCDTERHEHKEDAERPLCDAERRHVTQL